MSGFLTKNSVLFDLTWFLNHPSRAGVHRTVFELLRHWPKDKIVIPVVVDEDSTMTIISFDVLKLIRSYFEDVDEMNCSEISRELRSCIKRRMHEVTDVQIELCDGIILTETTYSFHQIEFYNRILSLMPEKVYAICHDLSPWLYAESFPKFNGADNGFNGYLQILRRINNIAFISRNTKENFETRIARRSVQNSIVIGGGADTFDGTICTPDSRRPEFVFIGTVASHKNHFLVLDVFEAIWKTGSAVRLTFVGQAGDISAEELERLEALCRSQPLFSWEKCASDAEVREILRYATALLYPGTVEGFGLPLLEGLYAGIPVIVSKTLPALEFAKTGAVAIDVTFDNLTAAILAFLNSETVEAKRREIGRSVLPTWSGVARKTAEWICASAGKSNPVSFPASPIAGFETRLESARAIHRLTRQDGPAFVGACFLELFGREARGSEMAAWSRTGEKISADKLDLLLFMISSEDFIQKHGAEELQKWICGIIFYKEHPGFPYDTMMNDNSLPHRDGYVEGNLEDPDPIFEDCVRKYRNLLGADSDSFVELCYRDLLDRPVEESIRKGYMDWLATTQTPDARKLIIREIAVSPENRQRKPELWLAYMESLAEIDVFDQKQVTLHKEIQAKPPSRSLFKMLMSLDDAAFVRFALKVNFGPRKEDANPMILAPEHSMTASVKAKYLLYLATLSKEEKLTNGMKSWLARIAFL